MTRRGTSLGLHRSLKNREHTGDQHHKNKIENTHFDGHANNGKCNIDYGCIVILALIC